MVGKHKGGERSAFIVLYLQRVTGKIILHLKLSAVCVLPSSEDTTQMTVLTFK